MKVDRALQEVWDWKDQIYLETKDLSSQERVQKLKKDVERLLKENRISLRVVEKESKSPIR